MGFERFELELDRQFERADRLAQLCPAQRHLFKRLCRLRKELAVTAGVPAFRVLNNSSLFAICEELPFDLEQFGRIPGVGPARMQAFAAIFVKTIRECVEGGENPPKT